MKSILVPAGGGPRDQAVFDTALALARPFSSHLNFYHVKIGVGEAAAHAPHVDFAMGSGLWNSLGELQSRADARSIAASLHVKEFCEENGISISGEPSDCGTVSASWQEEVGNGPELIMRRARHSDLVVMGRHTAPNGLPPDMIELLLLGCGRPIVIAPSSAPPSLTGTVVICWKECAEAARAVSAAIPILTRAERVVVVSALERGEKSSKSARELARYLRWHRIDPEVRCFNGDSSPTPQVLLSAAQECRADMVVMGGYGHSRMREVIFGGCTQTFIWDADEAAVFIFH